MLRGLIYLLTIRKRSLISHVRAKYDVAGEKLFQGINVWVSLKAILTSMLDDPSSGDVTLIIDGLDECKSVEAQCAMLKAFASSLPEHNCPFSILCTSRPESAIRDTFDSDCLVERSTRFELDEKLNPDADIELFLFSKFKEHSGV